MSRGKLPLLPLHQVPLATLADFYVLLSEKTKQKTRDGKEFFSVKFRDAKRTVSVAIWSDSELFALCDADWAVGAYFKVRGAYFVHDKYGPQIEIHQIRHIKPEDHEDGFREADFVERSRFSSEDMFAEICQLVETHITDLSLRTLTLALLNTHESAIKTLPASDRRFYPYPGGWLEHVRNVTLNCLDLTLRYRERYGELEPPLNLDLIVAGAVLHDIGRVRELTPGVAGVAAEPTVLGRVIGYVQLGRDMVREAAREVPDLNPDLLLLLEHLILSHLTLPEWGSPRLPVVPEALILHHADDLDAKLEMYTRCLMRDVSEGPFTDRDPVLNKLLWKSRSV
jgi:3'-5' exoribonuclease